MAGDGRKSITGSAMKLILCESMEHLMDMPVGNASKEWVDVEAI
jgi:hypothetical protein